MAAISGWMPRMFHAFDKASHRIPKQGWEIRSSAAFPHSQGQEKKLPCPFRRSGVPALSR
jgi:hypothetical protein